MMWIVCAIAALAAAPDDVQPVLAPLDAPEQFAEYMRGLGQSQVLACEPFWPQEALLCWRRAGGSWVTRLQLAQWQTHHAQLIDRAKAPPDPAAPWTRHTVQGVSGEYWTAPASPAGEHAVLLRPEDIATVVGSTTFLVSAPVQGVVIAWKPGNAELDHVIAVGATKMYDSLDNPVTPVVFRYDGVYRPFAEAKLQPTEPATP